MDALIPQGSSNCLVGGDTLSREESWQGYRTTKGTRLFTYKVPVIQFLFFLSHIINLSWQTEEKSDWKRSDEKKLSKCR